MSGARIEQTRQAHAEVEAAEKAVAQLLQEKSTLGHNSKANASCDARIDFLLREMQKSAATALDL
jgi:hypothetical protein